VAGVRRALFGLFAVLLIAAATGVHGQSALDGFDPNANGTVRTVVVQPDGKILLGGEFTTLAPNGGPVVTRNHIARLNPDGTLDAAFDPNANNIVVSLVVQPDGKILAGGFFTSMSGLARTSIARLGATTGQADSFDPGTNPFGAVVSMALQADGKIVVGGFFTTIGGQPRNHIARLDPITGQADSFNPNPVDVQSQDWVTAVAVQGDGKILVGGFFTAIGGQSRNYVARLNPATGLADSFNPNADGPVTCFAAQPDGKILIGGVFNHVSGQTRHRMARLDPTSGQADSFDPNADSQVFAIAVQADGRILVCGGFRNIGGESRFGMARLDAATGHADSFDPRADPHGSSVALVTSITLQADGKILVGGDFANLAPNGGADVPRHGIARLETDGLLDRTLDLNFAEDRDVTTTVVQPDGKILIGGNFSAVLGGTRHNIARLNTDGTLDLDFDPDASNQVNTITLQTDGKILLGGIFTRVGGQTRNNIARIDGVTGLADSFDPNVGPNFPFGEGVGAIVVQPDGKILIGGYFTSVSGQVRHNIARLDPITGQPDSFDPDGNNGVSAIALQADGRILVGGDFTSIGGQTRRRLARLNATTGLADSFDPNASCCFVAAIVVQPDGKILVGGNFNGTNSIGGQTRNYLARLDPTTGQADSFDPNSDGPVLALAVQADGKILVGGQFRSIGGQARSCFARLDGTTGMADSFDANVDQAVEAVVLQTDGKILVGGAFDLAGGQLRRSFVRLSNDTAAMQSLAVTPTTVTWVRRGSSQRMARVTFEQSSDNVTYTSLGEGTVAGSNWVLTGLNLPTGTRFYLRAQGHHNGGDGSNSITESVREVLLKPAAQAMNLSTRMRVQTGDSVGIAGFIITGTAPKACVAQGHRPIAGSARCSQCARRSGPGTAGPGRLCHDYE
jgi:uncharacterized delta-60 repeat protein